MPLLLHWQTMVTLSLLFYAVIYVLSLRRKRQAAREPARDANHFPEP
jgi:cbb3-type cytochrome oxidase subunit 3